MSDEKRPGAGGKRPFGKKPFGKRFDSPRRSPDGDRGPRREGGPRGGFGGKKQFGDRPARGWGDDRAPRPWAEDRAPRGPRPQGDAGDRPFRKKPFGDRGDRGGFGGKPSFGDRDRRPGGPRKHGDRDRQDRGNRSGGPGKFDHRGPRAERPDRNDRSRFRGMYNGPQSREDREGRQPRPYRRDPVPERDPGPDAAPPSGAAERPHLGENELRYHGKNACLALLKSRPDDIVRAYVLREKAEEFSPLIEFCAKNRKAYHLVEAGDLERLSDSIHHQGVCLIARAKRFFKEEIFFKELGAHRTLVIFLDGVANPHNLGAILRTAAHFGCKWVCVPQDEITKISPALYRTAEGGAELVNLVRVEDAEKFLDRMRSVGFQLYAFEPSEKAIPLFETRLNEKSVFVFGAEVEGLSGLVKSIVETKVTIPGTGGVESLNVSVAAAVAVAEFERQGSAAGRSVRIVKKKT